MIDEQDILEHEIGDKRKPQGAYAHILSGTLANFVESQLTKPAEQQNDIQEELALMRASAQAAVSMFAAASEKQDVEAMFGAGKLMQKELEAVARMANVASSIQAKSTDQLTRSSMELIISNIIELVFAVLRQEPNGLHLAARIEKEIQAKVNISVDRGTVSLPSDEMVALMDMTVPRE